jgi:hypothetical protein
MRHLSVEQLLDLAEGTADERQYSHLASCGSCRKELEDARAAIAEVHAVDVPEPSPLFWNHLSGRVHDAVAHESRTRGMLRGWWMPWRLTVAVSAAAVIIVAGLIVAPHQQSGAPSEVPAGPAAPTAALASDTPIADDPSLSFVADLASGVDWDSAAAAGLSARPGAVDGVLSTLSDDETRELQRLLTEALASAPARGGV